MVRYSCVREKKPTECAEPSEYEKANNGRLMQCYACASRGMQKKKTEFVKSSPGKKGGFRDIGNSYSVGEMLSIGTTKDLINPGQMGSGEI